MRYEIKIAVVDTAGVIHHEGKISNCKAFIRLCTASIDEVSENDEVMYGDLLSKIRNVEWSGNLHLKPVLPPDLQLDYAEWLDLMDWKKQIFTQ